MFGEESPGRRHVRAAQMMAPVTIIYCTISVSFYQAGTAAYGNRSRNLPAWHGGSRNVLECSPAPPGTQPGSRGSLGAVGPAGPCQPWDVPWASRGVLGHPGVSVSPAGPCRGSGAAITMATFPSPQGEQRRAMADVSSFRVIVPCFTFPLQPHEPGELGTQGSLSHTAELLRGHKRCFLTGYGGTEESSGGLGQ